MGIMHRRLCCVWHYQCHFGGRYLLLKVEWTYTEGFLQTGVNKYQPRQRHTIRKFDCGGKICGDREKTLSGCCARKLRYVIPRFLCLCRARQKLIFFRQPFCWQKFQIRSDNSHDDEQSASPHRILRGRRCDR